MSINIDYGFPVRVCDICGNEIDQSYSILSLHYAEIDHTEPCIEPTQIYEIKRDDICHDCLRAISTFMHGIRRNDVEHVNI